MTALMDRFWTKVDQRGEDDCWPWTASRNAYGYGQISWKLKTGRRPVQASRVAYMLSRGEIPDGMWVLHSCDNPACCNPRHLRLGTPADNSRDMSTRGRVSRHMAKITPDDVHVIRHRALNERQTAIARDYEISPSAVNRIVNRNRWQEVI